MVGCDKMEGASYFVEVDEMKVLNPKKESLELRDKVNWHWKEEERQRKGSDLVAWHKQKEQHTHYLHIWLDYNDEIGNGEWDNLIHIQKNSRIYIIAWYHKMYVCLCT